MWVIYALVLHTLLLGSIFVIYFRSPVITNLEPQAKLTVNGLEAPANRLVLIVTDGLRAESFFENQCDNIPHLRQLFIEEGLVGISHTRVPTESRPGHIALIAGLYEDPSAVTRGWKENPIEFDTVFNRSGHTYAWGHSDVLNIFSRLSDGGRPMYFDSCEYEIDFSGKNKTYQYDAWVFDRVPKLLRRKQAELQQAKSVVFFLHLLGLDSAGHVHKPGSKIFLENLHYTERRITEMYYIFEKTFPDRRTAYLLTSDHGMTNSGSHGAGDPHETDTPFFLWGAGVARNVPNTQRSFSASNYKRLPLQELEQAQLTPLMSALIGLPPPMNNFGILPIGYLNVSVAYEAQAMHSNALQLLAQYKRLLQEHQQGFFTGFLNHFEKLTMPQIDAYIAYVKQQIKNEHYDEILRSSVQIMDAALEGIIYYHNFYSNALLISTTLTFLGWICYLSKQLLPEEKQDNTSTDINLLPFTAVTAIILTFIKLQKVPFAIGFYLLLPVFVWLLALRGNLKSLMKFKIMLPIFQLLQLFACAETLVLAFFHRGFISAAYLLYGCCNCINVSKLKSIKFYIWILLLCTLALFPMLPIQLGYQNSTFLVFSIVFIIIRSSFTKYRVDWRLKLCSFIGLTNGILIIYLHIQKMNVPLAMFALSWIFLFYSILSIIFNKTNDIRERIELIFHNLTSIYMLFCTSYESLFVQLLAIELMISIKAQHLQQCSTYAGRHMNKRIQKLEASFHLAFCILLYTYFSFFGTGNIASVNSFDPNVMRCFLSTFWPHIITGLVVVKLIIPVLLNVSIIFGLSEFARVQERTIYICMLLICDIMGLNFLFLVRNQGSWLEIGSSISHFVIMEVSTLVLLLFTFLAKLLLKLPIFGSDLKLK